MGKQTEALATLVAETSWDAIPETVRDHAKLVLLDTVGVILAGSVQPDVAALRPRLVGDGGTASTVFGPGFPLTTARTAALLNGIAGRSIELCEGHRFVSCQAAIQVLPTVLAVAEARGASGADALAALVLGYEAAVRIASGTTPRPLAHQNGQAAMLGAVAAGARLHGFSAEQMSRALRIGTVLVLTPSYTNVAAGATALNVAGGMSGFAGTLVPELVGAGFEAQPDAIEQAFGQLVGDGFDPERIGDQLGERWEITRDWFRLRACCNPIYAALDALEACIMTLRPRPDEIEQIEVATYHFASVMREPEPRNSFAAHYSLPHAAAALVVRGDLGLAAFEGEALRDPTIAALRRRVRIEEDPTFTSRVPALKSARVTVRLRDGRTDTQTCEDARGDFQQPYARAEILTKFRDLAGMVLTAEGIDRVQTLLLGLDGVADLREVVRALREHSQPV
jgi:2-methylcitrate dehydratase PrpD